MHDNIVMSVQRYVTQNFNRGLIHCLEPFIKLHSVGVIVT